MNKFQKAIEEIIQEAPNNQNTCDFSGCYFPPNYDCFNLIDALVKFDCCFYRSTFFGEANFTEFSFYGKANFGKAIFSKKADFAETKFSKEARFEEAIFFEETYFTRATFYRNANFYNTMFYGGASFAEASFKDTSFMEATFSKFVDFSCAQTHKRAIVSFTNVKCLQPQQVRFHHVDLSRWSFLDTDLHRIDFHDVTWAQARKFLGHRPALFDELNVTNKKEDLAKVEQLYRHLKQNYESQRDYARAGDFYYGEMEMKRRQQSWPKQIPFLLYRWMSDYGESYGRALIVLIAMWLTFALLFTLIGYSDPTTSDPPSFARSLIYSAQSMTLFHEPKIVFHSIWGQAVELIASILGVIQIALFGLALQRRFKR